jgi:hypothetical protein
MFLSVSDGDWSEFCVTLSFFLYLLSPWREQLVLKDVILRHDGSLQWSFELRSFDSLQLLVVAITCSSCIGLVAIPADCQVCGMIIAYPPGFFVCVEDSKCITKILANKRSGYTAPTHLVVFFSGLQPNRNLLHTLFLLLQGFAQSTAIFFSQI